MKYGKLYWDQKEDRNRVIRALERGDVVVGTTDTVLGLLADATEEGFERLNQIKGRSNKPYLMLVDSPEKIGLFVSYPFPDPVKKIMKRCWPGPLTIILKAKRGLCPHLVSSDDTIAFRIPKHAGLLAVLEYFDGLFSTSANLAGEPIPATVDQLDPKIYESAAAIIVDSDAGKSASLPSTIIDCSGDEIKIVREGAYSRELLMKIIS